MKKLGTYKYKFPMYSHASRAYQQFEMRVEIVTERGNRYRIKYLGFHANGAAVNSLHWVRKDKVKLDHPVVIAEVLAPTYTQEVRMPYKDD